MGEGTRSMGIDRTDELATSGRGCGSIWNALLAADDTDVDVELLAAFAEGRLSNAEREAVRAQIARSPMAMEIVDSLYDYVTATDEQAPEVAEPEEVQVSATRAPAVAADEHPRRLAIFAAAASLLLAVGTSYLAYEQWQTRATTQARLASVSQDLISAYKAKLHGKSNATPVLVGAMTGDDLLAMLEHERTRGPGTTEPEGQAEVRQLLNAGVANVEAAFPEAMDRLVEEGALYLASGNAAEAEKRADEGLKNFGRKPELLNLKAAALLAKAKGQKEAEAEKTLREAESLLSDILDSSPAFAPAWFNLAVWCGAVGDGRREHEAWQKYLEHEPDPARCEAIRRYLGLEEPSSVPTQ